MPAWSRALCVVFVLHGCTGRSDGSYTCVRVDGELGDPCSSSACLRALACVAGTCVSRVGFSERCATGQCEEGYHCDLDTHTCRGVRRAAGEGCTYGLIDDCDVSLICARNRTSTSGRCRSPRAEGEMCVSDDECAGASCGAGPCVCASGFCAAAPREGELCSAANRCGADLTCASSAGGEHICLPYPSHEGDACGRAEGCPEGMSCVIAPATGGVCLTDLAPGSPCIIGGGGLCVPGTYCDGARCQAVGELGEACVSRDEPTCADGLVCQTSSGGRGTCAPLVEQGGDCGDGQWCGPNLRCDVDTPGTPPCVVLCD